MKKNTPGCATVDCCAPCCSAVWEYLRNDYSNWALTLNGTDSGLSITPSNPITGSFVESTTVDGVVYYQCAIEPSIIEYSTSDIDYYSPANPRRYGEDIGPPGFPQYRYSQGYAKVEVVNCDPLFRVTTQINYLYCASTLAQAIIAENEQAALGYASVGLYLEYLDSPRTHRIFSRTSGGLYLYGIVSSYVKSVTSLSDIMSAYPSTISLAPHWNPFSMSLDLAFS